MRRLLSNSAMAFILISLWLVWKVYRGSQDGTLTSMQQGLCVAGAVLAGALGLAGMKERHRRQEPYE